MNPEKMKVLLLVDGSYQAYEAVNYAGSVLPASRCEVTLFHVMSKVPDAFWDLENDPVWHQKILTVRGWEKQQEHKIYDFMERSRQLLRKMGFGDDAVRVEIRERKEGIARDIVHEAGRGYDAVMMGRKGHGSLDESVLGSVASKLMGKLGERAVWVIGGKPGTEKILIAMDPSEGAMRALEHAVRTLNGSAREICLVHVVRGVAGSDKGLEEFFPEEYRRGLLEEAKEAVRGTFEKARERLVASGIPDPQISTRVITGVTSRAGAVMNLAREGDFGTIVVGRRGISKVEAFDMGRVSNKLIQMAKDRALCVVG
ncbi:MAG TPA: universal stress protein [Syntrophobacteraceae bacterium]|nr:universal stress protein [Syntrophobacteraceae bacterium]